MADTYGDPLSAPFWDAAARHELLVQRCHRCGHSQLYPRVVCLACGGLDLGWAPASTTATVVVATEVHVPAHPTLAPPYTVALVELPEGPRLLGNPSGARAGDTVRLVWRDREGAPPLPDWEST